MIVLSPTPKEVMFKGQDELNLMRLLLSFLWPQTYYKELQMVVDEEGTIVDETPIAVDAPIEFDLDGPIELDLGAIRDELVVKGWHPVKVERAEAGLSSQKQIPQVFILSRCTDEDDPDFNRTIIWNCMLQGDGLLFTKRCFKAAGMPETLSYPTAQALADELVGCEFEAQVQHKKNKNTGELQVRISNWRPITAEIIEFM